MFRKVLPVGLIALMLFTAFVRADGAANSITIGGAVDKPGDWTAARLKSELSVEVTSVSYTSHGDKHMSTAVPLIALLKASGVAIELKKDPKADPKKKHYQLRLVAVVAGRDGYLATFSLAELMSELGNRSVYLAMDEDGQPLPDSDGPFKLIATDDQKPARWVHGVASIKVVDVTELAK